MVLLIATLFAAVFFTGCSKKVADTKNVTAPKVDSTAKVVKVTLNEWTVVLDPATIGAGQVQFDVANEGKLTHSFEVKGQGIDKRLPNDLASGEAGTMGMTLTAGEYTVLCPIDGHAAQGMTTKFTVK